MARSSARLCARCKTIVRGQCPRCSVGWNDRKPESWAGSKRGDSRWRKVRAAYLSEHPLCSTPNCGALADTVDHIDGTDYDTQRYDWNFLRSLCTPCHRTRTTMQGNAAQGRGGQG